ncbi:doublecortin domain-containing protein 2C-like isoform X2 [Anthonomus grandis grandis]|uniref:doublecortin domain-containing protein 2C-like isoform X2 n=1 Tax=Anthonomus grandis grandis TaxID=2921223 RepID=UPI002165B306|nr:doublecortin domain-containing protein 2C-like isoform X2 [Anthonomus grandis grandis]
MYHLFTFPLPTAKCYLAYQARTFITDPTMTIRPRTWHTLGTKQTAKSLIKFTIWVNKDFDTPGQEITLHYKDLRSWNSTLNYLTAVLQPRFGAVRKLYNLETQKLVLCLQDIKANGKYVATGSEKFKFIQNGYLTADERIVENKRRAKSAHWVDDVAKHTVNFMDYTKKYKRTVIHMMVSGRPCQTPIKMVLIERDLIKYNNMLLEYMAYRLDIGEGIKYITTTKGKIISDPLELKHGGLYVAVPFGTDFIKMDYKKLCIEMLPAQKVQIMVANKKKRKKPRKKVIAVQESTAEHKEENLGLFSAESTGSGSENEAKPEREKCICSQCTHDACAATDDGEKKTDDEVYIEVTVQPKQESAENDSQMTRLDFEYPSDFADFISKKTTDSREVQVNQEPPKPVCSPKGDIYHDDITKESTMDMDVKKIPESEERPKVETTNGKNFTTFAEIAREKAMEKELNSELIRNVDLSSICSVGKKSVTFPKDNKPAETKDAGVFVNQDRVTEDKALNTDITRLNIEPKCSSTSSDSIVEGSCSSADQLSMDVDSVEYIPEGEYSIKEEDIVKGNDKAVQKGWKIPDDINNKGIQVEDKTNNPRPSEFLYYFYEHYSDIYQNFEKDKKSDTSLHSFDDD